MQLILFLCLLGMRKTEYEAVEVSKLKKQELELMETLQSIINKDNSVVAWAKRKDTLCFGSRTNFDSLNKTVFGSHQTKSRRT